MSPQSQEIRFVLKKRQSVAHSEHSKTDDLSLSDVQLVCTFKVPPNTKYLDKHAERCMPEEEREALFKLH